MVQKDEQAAVSSKVRRPMDEDMLAKVARMLAGGRDPVRTLDGRFIPAAQHQKEIMIVSSRNRSVNYVADTRGACQGARREYMEAIVAASGSVANRVANAKACAPVDAAQQAPKSGSTCANARQQRNANVKRGDTISARARDLQTQIMGHPESRNAAQSIMASKGWTQLPNDPQALDLLSDRIDDIISSKEKSRASRQRLHEKRSYYRNNARQQSK